MVLREYRTKFDEVNKPGAITQWDRIFLVLQEQGPEYDYHWGQGKTLFQVNEAESHRTRYSVSSYGLLHIFWSALTHTCGVCVCVL